MFEEIANNQGKLTFFEMYAPGANGFVNHYTNENVFRLFRKGNWDAVVLQPGSAESAGVSFPVNTTIARGRVLLDSIYHYNSCANVYLYEIPYGVPSENDYDTYFSVQTIIRDSITKMADSLRLQIIPAGECFRAYYSLHPNLFLHGGYNDIHPNANGSFMVASSCYTTIFQDTVLDCTYYSNIPQETAATFFSIVDTVVLNHLADWRINTFNLHSDYDFVIDNNTVSFTCLSSNYSTFLWDFGDGDTSASTHPIHTFLHSGTYHVKLHSYSNGCSDVIEKLITINNGSAIENILSPPDVIVFPNPTNTTLNILLHNPQRTQYKITNIRGLIVKEGFLHSSDNQFDISDLTNGTYLLQIIYLDGKTQNTKIIKQ